MKFENDYIKVFFQQENFCIQQFKAKKPSDEEFDEYLDMITETHSKYTHSFGLLIDIRQAQPMTFDQRKQLYERLKSHHEELLNRVVAQVYLTKTILQNTILSGILRVSKPPVPYTTTSSLEASVNYLSKQTDSKLDLSGL